jgi:hypothetical protein
MRVSCAGAVLDLSGVKPLKPQKCMVYFWFSGIISFSIFWDYQLFQFLWIGIFSTGFRCSYFFSNDPVLLNDLWLVHSSTFKGAKLMIKY